MNKKELRQHLLRISHTSEANARRRSTLRKRIEWVEDINGCWLCVSHTCDTTGYPHIGGGIKNRFGIRLFRLMYREFIEDFKKGTLIRHMCDNRFCINPKHLSIGTIQDNIDDMCAKGNHARGEVVGNSKLTANQALEIYYADGTKVSLAKKYRVSTFVIHSIKQGISWSHVTGDWRGNRYGYGSDIC